jgi:hypothetical protein
MEMVVEPDAYNKAMLGEWVELITMGIHVSEGLIQ